MKSSRIRNQTHVPCTGRQILNDWITREVLNIFLNRYVLGWIHRLAKKIDFPFCSCVNLPVSKGKKYLKPADIPLLLWMSFSSLWVYELYFQYLGAVVVPPPPILKLHNHMYLLRYLPSTSIFIILDVSKIELMHTSVFLTSYELSFIVKVNQKICFKFLKIVNILSTFLYCYVLSLFCCSFSFVFNTSSSELFLFKQFLKDS